MSQDDHLPSLALLRCFDAAAKRESFTSAAEELGLTQSAVSRQVRDLEAHIGTALFRREGRGVRLTDAGHALARPLHADLARLRRTLQHAIATGVGPEVLTLAAPPTFAARWLVPRLPQFRAAHENVDVVLYSRPEPFDLHEEQVDIAVHFGGLDWPGAQLTPLCPEDLVAVAAPALIARHTIATARDVLNMPLLHLSARPRQWEQFAVAQSCPSPSRSGSHFDQFSLVIAAAVAGMGAAILPTYLIEEELGDGRLCHLADVPSRSDQSYFIATPTGETHALAKAFTLWLRKQVNGS